MAEDTREWYVYLQDSTVKDVKGVKGLPFIDSDGNLVLNGIDDRPIALFASLSWMCAIVRKQENIR